MLRHQRSRPRLAAVLVTLAVALIACQSNGLGAHAAPPVAAEMLSAAADTEADEDNETFLEMPSERTEDELFFDVLDSAHEYLGYLVTLVVLGFTVVGFIDRRERGFAAKLFAVPAVLIDVQVLVGLLVYVVGGYWEHPSWWVRLLHPFLALSALAVSHFMVGRARRNESAVAARRTAATGLLIALLLIAGALVAIAAG